MNNKNKIKTKHRKPMDQLHGKLMDQKGSYHFWHSHRGHQVAHWAVFLFVGAFMTLAIYARINNVGFLAQLRGMLGLASTEIVVAPSSNLQTAINNAQCGDTIVLQAGATWDTANPYQLPNKGCSAANPITIRSSRAGSLPSGRVSPADATNMARIRTSNGSGAFQSATNAGFWIFDGLEVTDIASGNTVVNFLFDFASFPGAHDITIQRSYIHPKEIGTTTYTRAAVQGLEFEGSGLLFKWNYAAGFLGRQPDGQLPSTRVILCITCNYLTVTDNFLEAWYTSIFTGGGGENPEYTATLSGTPTTTQANFSNVTDLQKGVVVRFNLEGSGTLNSATSFTRSSGAVLTSADVNHTIWITNGSVTERAKITAVDGNNYTLQPYNSAAPTGATTFVAFETAEVTSVSGNTVSYTPVGLNYLTQSPTVPGSAAWRVHQVVHDITITKNTFNIDIAHAQYEHSTSVNHNSPKGWVEMKAGDKVLYEGNHFIGYPSALVFTQHSNEGFTPWTNVQNLTIRSNYVDSVYDVNGTRQWIILSLSDPYATDTLGCCVTITNNLVKNVSSLAQVESVAPANVTHNTVLNNHPSSVYGSYLLSTSSLNPNWTLTDNIVMNNTYGIQCYIAPYSVSSCWPQISFHHNAIVDNNNNGDLVSRYGAGVLSPIVSAISQIGFANPATNDYRLSSSSPFKNKASDGTDPGVNWTALVAALGFDPTGASTPGDTTPPTTSITDPLSGTTVSGSISVAANASDDVGISRVEFLRDGSVFATDNSSPYTVSFDTTTVGNGSYTLQSRAYDPSGNAGSSSDVSVTVSNQTSTQPPSSCPTTIPSGAFLGCYFDNKDLTGAVVVKNFDPYPLNYNWGTGSPDPSMDSEYFSARWVGNFSFEAGDYTFAATVDDGVRMYVDNQLVIDKWLPQAVTTYTAAKTMTAGTHQVKIEYYEDSGEAVARLSWTKIPATSKSHLTLSPASVSFAAVSGGAAPAARAVALGNPGTAASSWSAQGSQDWCHVAPASGTLSAGGSASLSVSVDEPSNVGTFSCTVTVSDPGADNSPQAVSVSYAVTPAPEPAATPSITSFSVSSKTATTATVTWTTDQPTAGVVRYGTSRASLGLSKADPSLATSHSVTLTGLSAKSTYYYQVQASNGNGSSSSIVSSFRTKPR